MVIVASRTLFAQTECENSIKSVFRDAVTDRSQGPASRKRACLYLVVNMFKIHFKLGTIRLCKNLVHSIESGVTPSLEELPRSHGVRTLPSPATAAPSRARPRGWGGVGGWGHSHDAWRGPRRPVQVPYLYYKGRLLLLEEKFGDAAACLSAALRQCHRAALRNRRWAQRRVAADAARVSFAPPTHTHAPARAD